jgi:outer membrane protein assembly complex protein YaeT
MRIGARLLVCLLAMVSLAAAADTNEPARLKISGFGWLGNRELKRTILLLQGQKKDAPLYDANFVEDAALILLSKVTDDGYLQPRIEATLTTADGAAKSFEWDARLDTILPRPLEAKKVHFSIRRGPRFYYRNLEIVGLKTLSESKARSFFMETDLLVPIKGTRIYTPSRLERSVADLREALARKGFAEATVTVSQLDRSDRGAVRVRIEVKEGLPTTVRSVRVEVRSPEAGASATNVFRPGRPYSRLWLQDFAQNLRTNEYQRGFPDATAEITTTNRQAGTTNVQVDLLAHVQTGPRIHVGEVNFTGNERSRLSVLKRRTTLKPGDELDRLAVERGRERLARLGIFDSVTVRYDPAGPGRRDVTYELKEGKTLDFSLLFGYGSYELLRGGFELDQHNLWGRAHKTRLRATQSFRSSSGDFLYTIPEVLGRDGDLFFNASGLRREELSFVREEFGGAVGVQRFSRPIDSDASLRYSYQLLNAAEADPGEIVGLKEAQVAAWILDLRHDHRDNPLLPRRGYKVLTTVEFASAALGGEVDYQRVELGTSFHQPLGGGRFLHLGVSHGAIGTLGGSADELPFTKRFFPGGENSIRGFQQGEASPRNAVGKLVGAETYLLGNVEFEQVLTPSWSLVVFFDAIGFAQSIESYPADEELYSAGGGIRWKTIIGPARLEYGHNLNPRAKDPTGTLHFSLGFPF